MRGEASHPDVGLAELTALTSFDDGNTKTETPPDATLPTNACLSDCSIAMKTCGNGVYELGRVPVTIGQGTSMAGRLNPHQVSTMTV